MWKLASCLGRAAEEVKASHRSQRKKISANNMLIRLNKKCDQAAALAARPMPRLAARAVIQVPTSAPMSRAIAAGRLINSFIARPRTRPITGDGGSGAGYSRYNGKALH